MLEEREWERKKIDRKGDKIERDENEKRCSIARRKCEGKRTDIRGEMRKGGEKSA